MLWRTFSLCLMGLVLSAGLAGSALAQMAAMRRAPAMALHTEMRDAWQQVEGCGKRIAISQPERPFITECGDAYATQVMVLDDAGKFIATGGAGSVAIPWVGRFGGAFKHFWIAANGLLQRLDSDSSTRQSASMCVKDVSMGVSAANANADWTWALVCPNGSASDYSIVRQYIAPVEDGDQDLEFHSFPGAGVRIAAGLTDGVAWVVNSYGDIWRQQYCKSNDADETVSSSCQGVDEAWDRIPGCARSIANAGRNRVWAIGCDTDVNGNGSILQYAGAGDGGPIAGARWKVRSGRGKEIAVDLDGRPWVLQKDGSIWRWSADVPAKGATAPSDPVAPPAGQNPN